jgi:hypothetical protein
MTLEGVGRRQSGISKDPAPAIRERNARESLGRGKWCPAGQHWQPLEAFAPNENLNSGLDSWCRSCHAERTRQWRAANSAYLAEYNERRRAEYRAEHPRALRPCVVCGKLHSRKPGALVCGERCRNRRNRELKKQKAAA